MIESKLPQTARLTITPDRDDISWTHFTVPNGMVIILEDLPRPLRAMISGFVGTLVSCGIERLKFDSSKPFEFHICPHNVDIRHFKTKNPASVQKGLILTAWWIEFTRRRQFAQVRKRNGVTGINACWECSDCEDVVSPDRDLCKNPKCQSWNNLYFCTQEPSLRLVPRSA